MSTSTAATSPDGDYVLTLSCPDTPGIVYSVTKFLFEHDCNIIESQQFGNPTSGTFFMRVQFAPHHRTRRSLTIEQLRVEFTGLAAALSMSWRLTTSAVKQRVLIMVSKFGHCLNDLLYRSSIGSLNIEVSAVVSNHPDLGFLADNFDIPFHHVPVTPETKPDAEAKLLTLVEEFDIDLVVLARYMQILSPDLCERLAGRAINIHHSMLPSFKGARPYHQAHARGVKVVGATAHYVTTDLDEGPIIEQEVARVNHSMSAEDVTALGRDTESLALARAVQKHTQNRVLLDGKCTVVFT